MNTARWVFGIIVVLLVLPLALAAQSGTQTLDLGDGIEISVPAAWEIDTSQEDAIVARTDDWSVVIITPASLESQGNDALTARDAVEMLRAVLEAGQPAGTDLSVITKMPVGSRVAARFTGPDDDRVRTTWVMVPIEDSYGLLVFIGNADAIAAEEDMLAAIVASFDVATPGAASAAGSTAAAQACTVRSSSANSGQLRVGPGENRSAIAFLPANTDVTVTGRTELDDGSVWYQLDKNEAAPQGTAAAELWVSAENVEATGGCDTVGETSAPPVIPISVAPPAATAAPGEPAPTPVQAGALPAAGVWTLSLAPITNASCLGYENVAFNTAEVYTQPTFNGTVSIRDGGSFTFDGGLFRRNGASNSFSGAIEIAVEGGGSITTQFRFDLISATRMTGQMVANYNADDGTPCSDTVTFSASR